MEAYTTFELFAGLISPIATHQEAPHLKAYKQLPLLQAALAVHRTRILPKPRRLRRFSTSDARFAPFNIKRDIADGEKYLSNVALAVLSETVLLAVWGNAMLSRCVVMTLAAIICSGIAAYAEDKKANDQVPQSTVNIAFGRYGFHSDPKVSTTGCNVLMNLDQKTFLDTFQEIHKPGHMNETLDRSKANTLSLAFLFQILPAATKTVYQENANADNCFFEQTIIILDDYGNDKTVLALSYNFTRAIYRKINWDNFPNQNMTKVAPGFRINPEFQAIVSGEHHQ